MPAPHSAEFSLRSSGDARRRGQLAHMLFFKAPMPGDTSGAELFGLDVWGDAQGMQEHYRELSGYERAFSGGSAHLRVGTSSGWQLVGLVSPLCVRRVAAAW